MRSDRATAINLKLDKTFQPCPVNLGDELYPNGVFEFNITRMLAFVSAHIDRFPVAQVELGHIPHYGNEKLNEETIGTADLFRPILLAEISPGIFNLIDGHHRVAKARREGVKALPAHRIMNPHHVGFLTSISAYTRYVEYWNGKLSLGRKRPSPVTGSQSLFCRSPQQ